MFNVTYNGGRMMVFMNEPDDMAWLKDVHGIDAKCAVLYGNEDCPSMVEAFDQTNPTINDQAVIWERDAEGVLRRTGPSFPN